MESPEEISDLKKPQIKRFVVELLVLTFLFLGVILGLQALQGDEKENKGKVDWTKLFNTPKAK